MEQVILVDRQDVATGVMEKMEAHRRGLLHRAFSVFVFNDNGEMLLQQRAMDKYHSGGLWTNTCCSHPRPGEDTAAAASRRLEEEMGFTTALTEVFSFTYQADFDNGLSEHEFDHVFVGHHNGPVQPDASEVSSHAYWSMEKIGLALAEQPGLFTAWFRIAFPRINEWWRKNGQLAK